MAADNTHYESFLRIELRIVDIVMSTLNPLKVIDPAVSHKFVKLAIKYRSARSPARSRIPEPRTLNPTLNLPWDPGPGNPQVLSRVTKPTPNPPPPTPTPPTPTPTPPLPSSSFSQLRSLIDTLED